MFDEVDFLDNADLCGFVKETLEKKFKVCIPSIEYSFAGFTFEVEATGEEHYFPHFWRPVAFGNGVVTFQMSLDDFQLHCQKLKERDFADAVKAYYNKVHGKDSDIVSIEEMEEKEAVYEGSCEVVVKVKPGKKFVNDPYLTFLWAKDDLLAFEISPDELNNIIEHLNYQNRK